MLASQRVTPASNDFFKSKHFSDTLKRQTPHASQAISRTTTYTMEALLDFSRPLNLQLLDQVCKTLMLPTGNVNHQMLANASGVLDKFKSHPQAWKKVDTMLSHSNSPYTHYFALQILEVLIKTRWAALQRSDANAIRGFLVSSILNFASTQERRRQNQMVLRKLNATLVEMIKKDWPHHWGTFVDELITSSQSNGAVCTNNLSILKILSEEVFDFSRGNMTQAKILGLKKQFTTEFSKIYQLIQVVLNSSTDEELAFSGLEAFEQFLGWVPLGYVFETNILVVIANKYLASSVPKFRVQGLRCLSEVASLEVNGRDEQFLALFMTTLSQIQQFLPPTEDFARLYAAQADPNNDYDVHLFIHTLCIFLTTFFAKHLQVLEGAPDKAALLMGHQYLVNISQIDDDNLQMTCLAYWHKLLSSLYHEAPPPQSSIGSTLMLGSPGPVQTPRRQFYAPILSRLRSAIIMNMAKPEEVLVVEDENGHVVREVVKNSTTLERYLIQKQTLVFLTHLNYEDTQEQMLGRLNRQVDVSEWSRTRLNTLCWAMGSIAGALTEDMEKRFLVTVIKELLGLCELKRGKDNKAVIASNIMYIVGQYPRFLQAHWKFLRTVVSKLFEFMHETHPGVQDMACDTFLKIAKRCRQRFVNLQVAETQPFIYEIIEMIGPLCTDLEPSQTHTFFEALGWMISAQKNPAQCEELVHKSMAFPNQQWRNVLDRGRQNPEFFKELNTCRQLVNLLYLNVSSAKSLGTCYVIQLKQIWADMLQLYSFYSQQISAVAASGNPNMLKSEPVKLMRSVKRASLTLVETYVAASTDTQTIATAFVNPLLDVILVDYNTGHYDSRDPEVLSLTAKIIAKLGSHSMDKLPAIFGNLFKCTLDMVTHNTSDYPDHRVQFFKLIKSINDHCCQSFFSFSPQKFKMVLESILWSMRVLSRDVSETGLITLKELLDNVDAAGVASAFYRQYFQRIFNDIFTVLTDSHHKEGFAIQCQVLRKLCHMVELGQLTEPIYTPDQAQGKTPPNQEFLRVYAAKNLASAFPNLSPPQIQEFIMGIMDPSKDIDAFKAHCRDFLVNIKEFSAGSDGDNSVLWASDIADKKAQAIKDKSRLDMTIPGMIGQNDPRLEGQMAAAGLRPPQQI